MLRDYDRQKDGIPDLESIIIQRNWSYTGQIYDYELISLIEYMKSLGSENAGTDEKNGDYEIWIKVIQ